MTHFFETFVQRIAAFVRKLISFVSTNATTAVIKNLNSIYSDRWHPHHLLRQEALEESVSYIKSAMPHAMIMGNELKVLSYALSEVKLPGMYLEFGVRTGNTINHIASRAAEQAIFGFDSFEGLPENWSGWIQQKGTFGGEGLPKVNDNVRLVEGWFDNSLPPFLADNTEDLAFAHIDSDIYSSAKTIFAELGPRIKPGTVIVFNEYFNYPNWQEHEYRALQEFCSSTGWTYEYLCWGKFEVAVRFLEISQTD